MKTISIRISGMSCGHCAARVENALKELDGVAEAKVDLQAGAASVSFDESKADEKKLAHAVREAGYEVQ